MDEPYIKVQGQWRYLWCDVDTTGQLLACLLPEARDEQGAQRFLTQVLRRHGGPATSTIDGHAANEVAIKSYKAAQGTAIVIRKVK